MRAVYEGSEVFVWLPTGYGKNLCYQALPFLMDYKKGLVDSGKSCGVLVVSTLIALMHTCLSKTRVCLRKTSSVKPNPFANVTIKIGVIFTLNACANSVCLGLPRDWRPGYKAMQLGTVWGTKDWMKSNSIPPLLWIDVPLIWVILVWFVASLVPRPTHRTWKPRPTHGTQKRAWWHLAKFLYVLSHHNCVSDYIPYLDAFEFKRQVAVGDG